MRNASIFVSISCSLIISLAQAIFLANDTSSSEQQLTITCPDSAGSGTLNGWSLSPDGTSRASDSVTIDTSSSKYTVNGNTLTVGNITSKDEGLYRCVYDQGQSAQLCVYVYGKFANWPIHESTPIIL